MRLLPLLSVLLLAGCDLVTAVDADLLSMKLRECSGARTIQCDDYRLQLAAAQTRLALSGLESNRAEAVADIGDARYAELVALLDEKVEFYEDERWNFVVRLLAGRAQTWGTGQTDFPRQGEIDAILREAARNAYARANGQAPAAPAAADMTDAAVDAPAAPQAAVAGPSFDCAKATTPVEKAICDSPRLSELDRRMSTMYQELMSVYEDKPALSKDQVSWLRNQRNACSDAECIAVAYETRIADLEPVYQYYSKPAAFR